MRTKLLHYATLAALVLLSAPGLVKAQDAYQGTFTLPFEAHWGQATLPAGDYTISLSRGASPFLLHVRGQGKTFLVLSGAVADRPVSKDSALTIVNTGAGEAITNLRAAELGLDLNFAVSKSLSRVQAERKSVARVNVPVRTVAEPVTGR